jgi:soluble lytic murein transglycosylase-like protein
VKWIIFLFAAAALAQTPPEKQPAAPAQTPAELQRAAMARQRTAVQTQAESVGARLKPWGDAITESGPAFDAEKPACDPLADSVSAPLIDGAAQQHGVDTKLLRAVIDQESAFRPCAVSSKGAQGLMQLMPATAEELKVDDPFDPKQSIDGGAKYLKQLLDKYKGDIPQTLAAYNAGPGATDQAKGVPDIPETRAYVDAILQKLGIKRTDQPSIQTPKPIEN